MQTCHKVTWRAHGNTTNTSSIMSFLVEFTHERVFHAMAEVTLAVTATSQESVKRKLQQAILITPSARPNIVSLAQRALPYNC